MDPTEIQSFVREAEGELRSFRNWLLVSRQEGSGAGLNVHLGTIRRLREKAALSGLRDVETVFVELENASATAAMPGQPLTDAACMNLLDVISYAEAEVVRSQANPDELLFDLGAFVDNSFDVLKLDSLIDDPAPELAPAELETPVEDEFEADEEMLEIFAEEAEELLGNIESNLTALKAEPENREALWEVRRHAHTFKGAAGIIGLKKPSKLAHRIEDLLDHLSQNEIVPSARILELITDATNCLRVITKGDASPAATEKTANIYLAFDAQMAELTSPQAVAPSEPAITDPPSTVHQPARPSETVENGQQTPPRPIVRVSINRLDELVRIVRDLVVSRSMMEQQIAEFGSHLEAMSRTTRRLQAANARIENDFEASMLGSQMPVSFNGRTSFDSVPTSLDEAAEFDSLELDRYTEFHQSSRQLSEATQDCFATMTALEALKDTLDAVFDEQRRLIEETQEKVMQIRLIRFSSIATRIQRAVRVTCEEENKLADVLIENPDVEIDTDLLDSLVEPLMHLIRNAVVHGIEPQDTRRLVGKDEVGRITVRLTNEETHIELKVSDDGRGISGSYLRERAVGSGLITAADADAMNADDLLSLMFLPGFTTAEKLTMSAGRGVGMSIVKESVEARNGSISIETSPQSGTTFTVRIPLAFAVAQALIIRSENHSAAIPLKAVKQITEIAPADISEQDGKRLVTVGTQRLELRALSDHFPPSQRRSAPVDVLTTLLIESGDVSFALVIDEIMKTEEIAIKPLGKPLDSLQAVIGAAVLGNGEIVPVLDVSQFFRAAIAPPVIETPEPEKRTRILVVDDSPSVRHMTSKVITSAGWEAVTAKDGLEALDLLKENVLPDVILTDVEMPRMDGYELVASVLKDEALRSIPMVFITSRAGDKHRERAAELGITEYLTKPFVENELVQLVERLAHQLEPAI